MVIALAIICALGIGVGAAWVMSGPRQQPDRAAEACWSTLADQLDLDYDAGGLLKGPRISGQLDGMTVFMDTLHQVRDGRKSLLTRFVLQHENLPEGLDRKSKAKPSDDPVKRAIAQVTRRNISELIKRIGATLSGGKLRWLRDGAVWHPDQTKETIKRIVQICDFLVIPKDDFANKLVTACRDENLPSGHRKQMQQLLFEHFSDSEECAAIAGEMLDDPDPGARLTAAKALGPQGAPALARIAQALDVSRDLREQAISELVTKIDASVSLPLLGNVIQSGNPEIGRTALNLIRRHRFLPAIRVMLDVAKNPGSSSDVICNVVDTIGEIGDANAQNVLMGLLRHDYLMVRRRAAVALGRIGTPSAVSQLRQCASEAGSNRRFRELCQRAIKKIEKRHGGSSSVDFDAAEAS